MAKKGKAKVEIEEIEPAEGEMPEIVGGEESATPGFKKIADIQRYKGLGEMDAVDLGKTTMEPAHRTMLRVEIEDAIKAEEIFTTLMGDEVPPRKQFIQDHAQYVKNLDI